jgi:hypothetical protein
MLLQPILSGRIRKWPYALIEYDLAYGSLKSIKDQVVVEFIVEHSIDQNFDGSACREGQGVGIVLILHRGAIFSNRFV